MSYYVKTSSFCSGYRFQVPASREPLDKNTARCGGDSIHWRHCNVSLTCFTSNVCFFPLFFFWWTGSINSCRSQISSTRVARGRCGFSLSQHITLSTLFGSLRGSSCRSPDVLSGTISLSASFGKWSRHIILNPTDLRADALGAISPLSFDAASSAKNPDPTNFGHQFRPKIFQPRPPAAREARSPTHLVGEEGTDPGSSYIFGRKEFRRRHFMVHHKSLVTQMRDASFLPPSLLDGCQAHGKSPAIIFVLATSLTLLPV